MKRMDRNHIHTNTYIQTSPYEYYATIIKKVILAKFCHQGVRFFILGNVQYRTHTECLTTKSFFVKILRCVVLQMLKTNSLESHIDIFKATDVNIKNVVFKYKTVLIFSIYFLALLKSEKNL